MRRIRRGRERRWRKEGEKRGEERGRYRRMGASNMTSIGQLHTMRIAESYGETSSECGWGTTRKISGFSLTAA